MSMLLCTLVFVLVGVVVFLSILGWRMNGFFRKRGMKSPPGCLPIVGHVLPTLTKRMLSMDHMQNMYNLFSEEKYFGLFQFTKPTVVLRDLELIKQITIKDFDHFHDRSLTLEDDVDLLFGNSLGILRGQKWRDMRATLSPAFTSSKMRGMFQFVVECGEQMADYYMKEMSVPENKVRGLIELEMKNAFTRYSNDVIATTAFGLKVNSFTESDNIFFVTAKEATDFTGYKFFRFFFMLVLPSISKILGIQMFPKKIIDFYRSLLWGTIKDREDNNIVRNDMIQLLMQARKGTLKHDSQEDGKETGFATVEESSIGRANVKRVWTDDEFLAQAVLFFLVGFDTASTLLCFITHELAIHPEIQRRLQEEVDELNASIDGKLTYDCLQKMKYMDMVVSETLRFWPPGVVLDRKCVKPYTLPAPNKNGKEVHLKENESICIPVHSIHHDPKYFKDPKVFDPERFSDENKGNIQPFTYLPFGSGPRNCIGSRFALMEAKAVIFNLLLKFDIVTTAKTQNPLKLKLDTFNMVPERGFWVGLKPRDLKYGSKKMSILLYILMYGAVGVVLYVLALGWWMKGYFKKRGVRTPPGCVPVIGHMMPTFLRKVHIKDFLDNAYNQYPDEKYVGILQFTKPIVLLRDVELIKQVAIKDFDHFADHLVTLGGETDSLFGNNLFNLRGQKWRDMRATLSPAFTSSKMRGMFQFVVECGEQMADYYMKEMSVPENKVRGLIELEMKDVYTRYANDVIATTAFGLKVNSFNERNNQFYLMGKEATDFTGIKLLIFFFQMFLPRLSKVLGIRFFSEKLSNFYRRIVWDTIKDREERNIIRNDMIQLLMEARKGTLKHDSHEDGKEAGFATVQESSVGKTSVKREWSDDDIVAQAVLFFVAGFDTSSTLLCFLTHELALHPEIQRRLQDEIDELNFSVEGKLTYDCLQKMKYMDMVVSETLRMWSPGIAIDRKCVKPYTLPPPNKDGKEVELRENDGLWIPAFSIHHDPKYFKDPEIFEPERFSDENKGNIQPFTYLPFGVGPRNCIGSRFALMEVKAVIFNLLLKFDIVTTAKTQNPLKLKIDSFNLLSERGFWVGFKPRVVK